MRARAQTAVAAASVALNNSSISLQVVVVVGLFYLLLFWPFSLNLLFSIFCCR